MIQLKQNFPIFEHHMPISNKLRTEHIFLEANLIPLTSLYEYNCESNVNSRRNGQQCVLFNIYLHNHFY